MHTRLPILLMGCFVAGVSASTSFGAAFYDMGLPPGGTQSSASSLSDDGLVATGAADTATTPVTFRWTIEGGMLALPLIPGATEGAYERMSSDGSVLVGYNWSPPGYEQAVYWTSTRGPTGLGYLPGWCCVSDATGVSGDGTIIVGSAFGHGGAAFRWTQATGMLPLAPLPAGFSSYAYNISRDGAVVIGELATVSNSQAFRWTQATSIVGLGRLPGDIYSRAWASSHDGSVIVGGSGPNDAHAFRWTAAEGMLPLGNLPGGDRSSAYGVSGNGSVVIGGSSTTDNPILYDAFIWDSVHGMRSLTDVLTAQGIDLTGWFLIDASAISGDGTRLVGRGLSPDGSMHGWFAILSNELNHPPAAESQTVSTDEDTPLMITLAASDVDQDPLTFIVDTAPSHGLLSGTPPNLSYLPATNYFGPDSFTFHVNDGQTDSAPATVSITVNPVNDPPVADASATPSLVLSPNGTNATAVLDGTRSYDVDNDPLAYRWFLDGPTNVLATGAVAIVVLPVGTNQIRLEVSDGEATSISEPITVKVITSSQAVQRIVAAVNSNLPETQSLIATLRAAIASFDRSNPIAAVNQLEAFQNQVRSQVEPLDAEVAQELLQSAQEVIDSLTDGSGTGRVADFAHLERLANGKVRLQLHAASARLQIIAASTNLVDWELIGIAVQRDDGSFEFEDRNALHFNTRFYRVLSP